MALVVVVGRGTLLNVGNCGGCDGRMLLALAVVTSEKEREVGGT